jgi:nucleotide-binding universal stress UspA family protein
MALKDLLVHIDDNPSSAVRLHLACEIARTQAAHVVGLHCIAPLQTALFSPWGDPGYSDFTAVQNIRQQYHAAALAVTAKIESAFRAETERAHVSMHGA